MKIKEIESKCYEVDDKTFTDKRSAELYIEAKMEKKFINDIFEALKFEVHEDHYKLLRRMYVTWESCEFGPPSIYCKKPYGNGDVYYDIAEILEIIPENTEDEWFTDSQIKYMDQRHYEMKNYLQILCRFGEIPSGVYKRKATYEPWVKIV